MPRPRRVPYWLDRFPASRRPEFPKHRGEIRCDAVVIGGGLTGCTIAWTFAAAGADVVLLEADRLGAAGTAASLGLVKQDLDVEFQALAAAYGLRAARRMWQLARRAALDFAAALRRLGVACDLAGGDALLVAKTADQAKRLRKEYDGRRAAGLDASWLTAAAVRREAAVAAAGAIKTRGDSQLDPYRACLGLAAAARRKGARIFERSPAARLRFRRRDAEVRTAGGTIQAGVAIVASGAPIADLKSLRRHFRLLQTYAVVTDSLPAAMRREVGRRTAAIADREAPAHALRWLRDDRILFSGAEQPALPPQSRERALVQRTGQLMYELSTMYPAISGLPAAWAWDAVAAETVDGVPYLGPHRNFPHHLFALGCGRHGAGVSYLAARILLRHWQGEPEKGDELFAFARIL
jgi:glycine/D-amino acid oxidase-like deaminating enzyme